MRARNYKRNVSAVSFYFSLVSVKIKESICIIAKVVNKDIVIQRSDLALFVNYVIVPQNFILEYDMLRKPPFEKVIGFF